MEKYLYPAIFEKGEINGFTVTFPDLPGAITEGDDLDEALKMAKECLQLHLYGLEEDGEDIPTPSDPTTLKYPKDSFITVLEVRMESFRDEMLNKAITKNVTLPRWLDIEANKEKINFSHVLQEALKEKLGLFRK